MRRGRPVTPDFEVRSAAGNYHVRFVKSIAEVLGDELLSSDVVLVDEAVRDQVLADEANWRTRCTVLPLTATETLKSYRGVEEVIAKLLDLGLRKKSRLIAIGGGVVQDVTGFAASILFRGVEWWFVPTTLLAQCDSCIGSKTSINFRQFKNQLGGFYPPRQVFIDFSFLYSLPEEEIRSGLGEMAHYYFVSGEEDFQFFRSTLSDALKDRSGLGRLITRSLAIKKRFIEADEFDTGERQLLNYGHSFGHALETITDYALSHGVAVSYGMDMANHVSKEMGLLGDGDRERMRELLCRIWEPYPLPRIEVDDLIGALRHDKKNVGDRLGLILSEGVGRMRKELVDVTPEFRKMLQGYVASGMAL